MRESESIKMQLKNFNKWLLKKLDWYYFAMIILFCALIKIIAILLVILMLFSRLAEYYDK